MKKNFHLISSNNKIIMYYSIACEKRKFENSVAKKLRKEGKKSVNCSFFVYIEPTMLCDVVS